MKILKYCEMNMGYDFIENITITENMSSDNINEVLSNLSIKTDLTELSTFINSLNNIVYKLNPENSLLISIAATLVAFNTSDNSVIKKDCRNILEELKLKGTGNGTVKTFVSMLEVLKTISSQLYNTTDIFNDKVFPLLNSISVLIDKYNITLPNLLSNINTILVSLNAMITKNGVDSVLNKINTNNISIDTLDKQNTIIQEII